MKKSNLQLQNISLFLLKPLFLIFTNIHKINNIKNIIVVICASLILSGCAKYDLGINFTNANNGELVQHIKLSEPLTSFSGAYLSDWLNTVQSRVQKLEGSVKHISSEEIILKIPFSSGRELEEKFSKFFNYHTNKKANKIDNQQELKNINSQLTIEDNNFLIVSRNRLIYDIDLRSLAILTNKENILKGTNSIINLDFILQTPWGLKNIQQNGNVIQPEKNGKQLVWKLKPGKLNHIEVVFWLPNMLGIGAVIIILFVWSGFYLRYRLFASRFVKLNDVGIAE